MIVKSFLSFIICSIALIGCEFNSSNTLSRVRDFVNIQYQKSYKKQNQTSSIDTIIKIKNNNFLVVVTNNLNNASASDSGTFDCIEVVNNGGRMSVKNSIFGLGDNTGGDGTNNLDYELVYLNDFDYLLLVNKNITHHGNYDILSFILNSRVKLYETNIIKDYTGITSGTLFSDALEIDIENKIMRKLRFRCLEVNSVNEDGVADLNKKIYEIENTDIIINKNSIRNIKLIAEVNEKSRF